MKIFSKDGLLAVRFEVNGAVSLAFDYSGRPVCELSIQGSEVERLADAVNKFRNNGIARLVLNDKALLLEGPENPTDKNDPLFRSVNIRVIKTGIGEAIIDGLFAESKVEPLIRALEADLALSAI